MFRNYCKAALRSLARGKIYSFINIAGLTLGLSASLLIALFVLDENQFDQFIPGGETVYRVYDELSNNQGKSFVSVTPPSFVGILQQQFPAVEEATRVLDQAEYKALFEGAGRQLYEQSGFYVDSNFFKVFPLPFAKGSSSNCLNDPFSIVLSREMAYRFFGNMNPVGKEMLIDKQPVHVTGVFEKNSKFHLQFNFLRPLAALAIPGDRMQSWQWQQFYSYLKLRKGTDVKALQAAFRKTVREKSFEKTSLLGFTYLPFFQPLRDIHLHSANFKFDTAQRGNFVYVNALMIIAAFIVIIACFNFINLSTGLSVRRAAEVGVRKAIGARRRQLVLQFMGETMLLVFCSAILGIGLSGLLLPWLNHFTSKDMSLAVLLRPMAIVLMLSLIGFVGILAGCYPAIVLSAFEPAKVLKSGNSAGASPARIPWLRQGLVVVQSTLSVLLLLSTFIVFRQVGYLHQKDLGFNKEQIMFFPMRGDRLQKNPDAFKRALLQLPAISSVSIGYGFPGDAVAGDEIIVAQHGRKLTQSVTQLAVDYDYIKTLQLHLVAGRDFSKEMGTDQDHAWIINETAVRVLGFRDPQSALGQTLSWHPWDGNNPDSLKTGSIIGVVRDFNYKSLHDEIEPAVLQIYPQAAWKVAVKIRTADIAGALSGVRGVWNQFVTDYPLEYKFLDEDFEQMYLSEDKLETLLWAFTGIALFLGCLGLYGLSAYSAESRKKEVSIRKVLGASAEGLVLLLSKDFIPPIMISLLIASPISWYSMSNWLQGFPYRVKISGWIFLVAGLIAFLFALLSVFYQAFRAARAKPAGSLRNG